MKPLIVTITGPSSSGKTVLSHDLHERGFQALVSTTTRPMRRGEQDGVSYHFITPEAFHQLEVERALIESIVYDNNHYGISSHEAELAFALGKPAALVVEPHGMEQVTRYCHEREWEILRVFVNNPKPVLVERMLRRVMEDILGVDHMAGAPAEQITQAVQASKDAIAEADGTTLPILVQQAVEQGLGLRFDHAQGQVVDSAGAVHAIGPVETFLKTHTSRMTKVLDFEQNHWVKPAVDGTMVYDLVFASFDDTNRQAILDQVCKAAHEKMEGPEIPRTRRARPSN